MQANFLSVLANVAPHTLCRAKAEVETCLTERPVALALDASPGIVRREERRHVIFRPGSLFTGGLYFLRVRNRNQHGLLCFFWLFWGCNRRGGGRRSRRGSFWLLGDLIVVTTRLTLRLFQRLPKLTRLRVPRSLDVHPPIMECLVRSGPALVLQDDAHVLRACPELLREAGGRLTTDAELAVDSTLGATITWDTGPL